MNTEAFKNPDSDHRPIYTVDWNDTLTKEKTDELLSSLKGIGAGGFYLRPLSSKFRPTVMKTFMEPEYLTEEYFELMEHAKEKADELGLKMLLYDEAGWPSGYANGEVLAINPDWAGRRLGSDKRIPHPSPYIREATDAFIDITYKRHFDRINGLWAAFTDEPSAGDLPWTDEFEKMFSAEEKEAITDTSREDDFSVSTRIKYRLMCGERFRMNWFEPLKGVCREHGVPFTGHLNKDNFIDGALSCGYGNCMELLRCFDIPGIDVIWRQIDMTHPRDTGCVFFPRFASSAAAQTGNPRSLSESFAIYGACLTGDEMRYTINAQISRGINLLNFMSVPTGRKGMLALAMRPAFVPEMPGYTHLRAINDMTGRASYIMSLGKRHAKTALYLPVNDILAGGEISKRACAAFDETGRRLERSGVDFDIADDKVIGMYKNVAVPENRYCAHEAGGNTEVDFESDSSELIAHFRELENGERVCYIYNESTKPVTACFRTEFDYVLQPENGEIKRFERKQSFMPGEGRAYLVSGANHECDKPAGTKVFAVNGFRQKPIKQFIADRNGVSEVYPAKAEFDGAFSGEISYRADVELPSEASGDMIIDLGKVECSAKVLINGKECGCTVTTPMTVRVPVGTVCGKRFTLEVQVANTAGNAVKNAELDTLFPKEEMGGYHPNTLSFEKESPKGGLHGPVRIIY